MNNSFFKSALIVSFITFLLLIIQEIPLDFYLFPMYVSGIISLGNIFFQLKKPDPYANIFIAVWIVMFISSYVAPIIHFRNDYWVKHMIFYPENWTIYAFYTSLIYFFGILIFHIFLNKKNDSKKKNTIWVFTKKSKNGILVFMLISFIIQTYVYFSFRGILGYINAFAESTREDSSFSGMGKFFIISELFPFLFTIYFIIKYKETNIRGITVFLFLVLLFISALYFGGLRGSRSNTIFVLVQAVIAVHLTVYKFKINHIIYFVIFFFAFMFIGRLYKDKGDDVLNFKDKLETRNTMDGEISEYEIIIIGDLSRYAVNSYQLFRLNEMQDYQLKYGQTYLSGILTFIPFGTEIRNNIELAQRSEAASELFYTYSSGVQSDKHTNSRILGLVGEWFINFGIITFFIPYMLMSYLLIKLRRWTTSILFEDIRIILVPIIMIIIPNLILADSNNIMFFTVKRFFLVYIILFLITKKVVKTSSHN
jgi:hypothetical protein